MYFGHISCFSLVFMKKKSFGIQLGVIYTNWSLTSAMLLAVPLPMRFIRGVAIAIEMQHDAWGGSSPTKGRSVCVYWIQALM